jgi:hypothetical protein
MLYNYRNKVYIYIVSKALKSRRKAMVIGKSVSIKSYGNPNGFWVIQSEWGHEVNSCFCDTIEQAKDLARQWESAIRDL